MIIARFPDAPARLTRQARQITDPAQLQQLHLAILTAADLAAIQRLVAEAHPA